MAYNHAREVIKRKKWKEKEEELLCSLLVDEYIIIKLRAYNKK